MQIARLQSPGVMQFTLYTWGPMCGWSDFRKPGEPDGQWCKTDQTVLEYERGGLSLAAISAIKLLYDHGKNQPGMATPTWPFLLNSPVV